VSPFFFPPAPVKGREAASERPVVRILLPESRPSCKENARRKSRRIKSRSMNGVPWAPVASQPIRVALPHSMKPRACRRPVDRPAPSGGFPNMSMASSEGAYRGIFCRRFEDIPFGSSSLHTERKKKPGAFAGVDVLARRNPPRAVFRSARAQYPTSRKSPAMILESPKSHGPTIKCRLRGEQWRFPSTFSAVSAPMRASITLRPGRWAEFFPWINPTDRARRRAVFPSRDPPEPARCIRPRCHHYLVKLGTAVGSNIKRPILPA